MSKALLSTQSHPYTNNSTMTKNVAIALAACAALLPSTCVGFVPPTRQLQEQTQTVNRVSSRIFMADNDNDVSNMTSVVIPYG